MAWLRRFMIRLLAWEYWPVYLVNIPIVLYYLYLSIRARNFLFFTNVNPTIENSGLLGESKYNILLQIPEAFTAITLFLPANGNRVGLISEWMESHQLSYPIILKPNIGERGFLVKKITSEDQLSHYLNHFPFPVLAQEFVQLPIELSISYYRLPGEEKIHLFSVCKKDHLAIRGDGRSTLQELIYAYPRAFLQWPRLKQQWQDRSTEVLPEGEQLILEPYGNHARGALFLDLREEMDDALHRAIETIALQMPDIHLGRFDLMCRSLAELKEGECLKILEFNGVGADPAHVFQPGFSIWAAFKTYFWQWRMVYHIYNLQKARGIQAITYREMGRQIRQYRRYMKSAKRTFTASNWGSTYP